MKEGEPVLKQRLSIVCTVPQTLDSLLAGQPRALAQNYEVTLICAPGQEVDLVHRREGVPIRTVNLTRRITPLADIVTLRNLYLEFRDSKPLIVQTYTPKAGLLGQLAGLLARVPIRVHCVVGMPLMEARGLRRTVLRFTEKLTYALSTNLTANSFGLRAWIQSNLGEREIAVIGSGSINGVDTSYFAPSSAIEKSAARRTVSIDQRDVVFLFVGRLVGDKGIEELITAFLELVKNQHRARLILVGDFEEDLDPLPHWVTEVIDQHPAIHPVGWVEDVRPFYRVSDVVVLPSYREGLPNALLEASAMGLPAVASDISGCNEVVVHNVTGLLVKPKDSVALGRAMDELSVNTGMREVMGTEARRLVVERFEQRTFLRLLSGYYLDVSNARNARAGRSRRGSRF